MQIENHMIMGQSYSDYVAGDFDYTEGDLPHASDIEWEKGELLDVIDVYDQTYVMRGELNGIPYIATGSYSVGELVSIDDIEIDKK